jgi:hypothetical protein
LAAKDPSYALQRSLKNPRPAACLSIALVRYVRDAHPTEEQFLTWLGPDTSCYHVLRKAGLLRVSDGRVLLSPLHLSEDGRGFHYEKQLFILDEGHIRTF